MPELFLYSLSGFPWPENTTRRPRGGNGLTLRNETALHHDQRNGNISQRIVAHTAAQHYARNWRYKSKITLGDDGTMAYVKSKSPSFNRRKLSAVVRKAITAYYTAEEQQEIAQAAKREGISMSSFVATASLAEARRGNRKQ